MKKLVRSSLLMSAIVLSIVLLYAGQEVHASSLSDIPIQIVDEINNTPYPTMTDLDFYFLNQTRSTGFTLESPGEVKAVIRLDIQSQSSGKVWISSSNDGSNIIGKMRYYSGAETEISWFLEKGTYFLFSTYGEIPSKDNNYRVDLTTVSIGLLFEQARTHEVIPTTSFVSTNTLKLDNTFRGFLSNSSPSDYYTFKLHRKASVTIDYSFDGSNSVDDEIGYCTLFDSDELFLIEGSYLPSDRGQQSITHLLEPGTYYIRMNGIPGNTTLNVTPMYYDIELTASGEKGETTEEIEINIDTSIEYSEIMVLHRDVKETLLNNNNLWSSENKAYVPIDGETFIAEDSGIYSVRITDIFGNNTMKKIEVSNIDITKPKIVGVKNNKSYVKARTITWSDEQSGIDADKTTLNGKKVKSGVKVKDEGKYVLKVYDKVGNKKTIKFNIDFSAPTVNVKNGATYKDIVILQIKDNVSGIKKVAVDNVEQAVAYSTLYFYLDGDYVVEVWDNADNYSKVEFKIKK